MAKSRWRLFRLTAGRKRVLASLGLLVAFVIALAAWSAGPTDKNINVPINNPSDDITTSAAPSVLPSATPSPTGKKAPGAGGNLLDLLPNFSHSKNVNKAGLPARQVSITITSDRAILRLGYRILNGSPDSGSSVDVASPAQINTVGYGYGLVAAVGAQATPIATYITCTVTVDGHVHSTHTVYGGYSVVVCLG